MSRFSNPFTEDLLNSRFNSKEVATRLIARTVLPEVAANTDRIIEEIKGPLDALVDNFFQTLTTHMGKEATLKEQVPDVPALRTWNPLGQKYVRSKGTAAFWLYTLSPKVQRQRSTMAKKLHGSDRRRFSKETKRLGQTSLINTLNGMSGLEVFGGTKITVERPGEAPYEYVARVEKRYSKRGVRDVEILKTVAGYNVRINIQLWSNFRAVDRAHVEQRLFERGQISKVVLNKLTNPRGLPRPLIRPWMAYYSQIRARQIIEGALKNFNFKGRRTYQETRLQDNVVRRRK